MKPTNELRFVRRVIEQRPLDYPRYANVLQQKWVQRTVFDTGREAFVFEWRDVPLVEENEQ
jgi:hypothetical protein